MKIMNLVNKSGIGIAGAMLAGMLLGLSGCNLEDASGQAVLVKDSTTVEVDFADKVTKKFRDSGDFDLVELRKQLAEKKIALKDVQITGLQVSYDNSTSAFLSANKDVKFIVRLYVKDAAGVNKLAVASPETDLKTVKILSFSPTLTLFKLNEQIFANPAGFPLMLAAIQDVKKEKLEIVAEIEIVTALKETGTVKLSMVVTVGRARWSISARSRWVIPSLTTSTRRHIACPGWLS